MRCIGQAWRRSGSTLATRTTIEMRTQDVLGWAAAALTLLSFSCSDILRLRYVALSANAAFIAYGFTAKLWPVLALHFVLVPVNVWRLVQTRQLPVRRRTNEGARP
jgi:hypothetical protein